MNMEEQLASATKLIDQLIEFGVTYGFQIRERPETKSGIRE